VARNADMDTPAFVIEGYSEALVNNS
jgi:hypothetical protein